MTAREETLLSRFRGIAFSGLVAAACLSGCATVTCKPVAIVVAEKSERGRLEGQFQGLRTSETGGVVEERRETFMREYWVKATDGQWYRISEADWKAAEVGKSLEVCR